MENVSGKHQLPVVGSQERACVSLSEWLYQRLHITKTQPIGERHRFARVTPISRENACVCLLKWVAIIKGVAMSPATQSRTPHSVLNTDRAKLNTKAQSPSTAFHESRRSYPASGVGLLLQHPVPPRTMLASKLNQC